MTFLEFLLFLVVFCLLLESRFFWALALIAVIAVAL